MASSDSMTFTAETGSEVAAIESSLFLEGNKCRIRHSGAPVSMKSPVAVHVLTLKNILTTHTFPNVTHGPPQDSGLPNRVFV